MILRRVLAIVALRLRLLARRSRGAPGVLRWIVTIVLAVMGGLFATGLALGFGLLTHATIATGDEQGIRTGLLVVFYTFFAFGVILPILTGALNPAFDIAPLRVYPFSRRGLYGITLAASALSPEHLVYYPALAAVTVTAVFIPGINVPVGLAVIMLAVLLYVAWGNALALLISRLMRQRKSREIVGIVAVTLLVFVAFAPSLFEGEDGKLDLSRHPTIQQAREAIVGLARVLPPTLAANALTALHLPETAAAWSNLLGLAVWVALGVVFGYRVFSDEQTGGRGGGRSSRRTRRSGRSMLTQAEQWFVESSTVEFVPRAARAVAAKELRYLFRSVVGRFNLLAVPAFVFFAALIFGRAGRETWMGFDLEQLTLFGLVAYTTMLSNNFLANAFAWEGDGFRAYILGPVPLNQVLFGKNLGVWIYNALLLVIVLLLWTMLRGLPGPLSLLGSVLLYAICTIGFTTVGNLISIIFPVARDISSIRNAPSQVGTLLSLLSLSVILLFVALILVLPLLFDLPLLQPVALLALLGFVVWIYRVVLRFAGGLIDERKERLIESLRVLD